MDSFKTLNVLRVFAIAALCLAGARQLMSQETNSIELTESDLFSLTNWQRSTVAIDGFARGMTRAQALELAEAKKLRLVPKGGLTMAQMRGPCVQVSCGVYKAQGSWVGINLFFDADKINRIEVGLSVDMDPEVKKANIARKFKGLTYQFFNNYADRLRNQILGTGEAKQDASMGRDTDHLKYVKYEYLQAGMVVHVTYGDQGPLDLEVDFVGPPIN